MLKILILFALLSLPLPLFAADCSNADYDRLVAAGKSANNSREWGRSEESYRRIVEDCRARLDSPDLAKAYDALSFAQLMQENHNAAIVNSQKCLEAEPQYNACMLTAAKAYDGLGDREKARESARAAMAVEPYDDYSSAVGIAAKSLLKQLEKP